MNAGIARRITGTALVVALAGAGAWLFLRDRDTQTGGALDSKVTGKSGQADPAALDLPASEKGAHVGVVECSVDGAAFQPQRSDDDGVVTEVVVAAYDLSAQPISGASVEVFRSPSRLLPSPDEVDVDRVRSRLDKATFATGASGAVTVKLRPGRSLVNVRAHGFASAAKWAEVGVGAIDFSLAPEGKIIGRVVHSTTQQPFPGAHVTARPRLEGGTEDPESRLLRTVSSVGATTGDDGRFTLDGLTVEGLRVKCAVDGFAPVTTFVVPSSQEVMIEVAGSCSATGVVVDENGNPVRNVKVDCAPRGILPCGVVATTTTAVDGTFHLDQLPSGSVNFIATAKDYAITKERRDLEEHEPSFVRITIVPRAPVCGRVVDDTGAPVANAFVRLNDITQDCESCIVHTEPDGTFETIYLHPQTIVDVSIEKDGYADVMVRGIPLIEERQTFVLPRLRAMVGRVVEAGSRKPVKRFSIRPCRLNLSAWEERGRRALREPITFETLDGYFTIPNAEPTAYELVFEADGYAPKRVEVHDVPPGDAPIGPVAVELDVGKRVRGRVVDEHGDPRPGIPVGLPVRGLAGQVVQPAAPKVVKSDSQGEFELQCVPGGRFDLLIGDFENGHRVVHDVCAADFPRDVVLEASGSIVGHGLTRWRSPATVGFVDVVQSGQWIGQAKDLEFDGSFRFDHLSPGEYEVTLHDFWGGNETGGAADLLQTALVEVRSGATTEVTLDLRSHGQAVGRVRAPRSYCTDHRLRALIETATERRRVTLTPVLPDGRFVVGCLEIGEYVAVVESDGPGLLLHAESAFTVRSTDVPTNVEVALNDQGVHGIVDGLGDSTADVSFVDLSNGRVLARVSTAPSGDYEASIDHSGRYLVVVSAAGFAEDASVEVELPPASGSEPLRHQLTPESRLEVTVVDDRGTPVPEVDVTLDVVDRPSVLAPLRARSDGRGVVRFTRLASGRALLSAHKSGLLDVQGQAIHLDSDSTRQLTVRLIRCSSLMVEAAQSALTNVPVTLVLRSLDDPLFAPRTGMPTLDHPTRWTDLAPGHYVLELSDQRRQPLELQPGELVTVKLVERSN